MKNKGIWILAALAGTTLAVVAHVTFVGPPDTPEALLKAAAQRVARLRPDYDGALRQLDLALELSLEADDHSSALKVLERRAEVHRRRGDYRLALEDGERILRDYAPDDAGVLGLVTRAALAAGEPERALEHAENFLVAHPTSLQATVTSATARVALARGSLERVREIVSAILPDELEDQALEDAGRAAALPPGTRGRVVALDAFELSLGAHAGKLEATQRVAEAGEHLEIARRIFTEVLAKRADRVAIEGILDILDLAGSSREVAILGALALRNPATSSMETLQRTARAFLDLELPVRARKLIADFAKRSRHSFTFRTTPSAELISWVELLEELELWGELAIASQQLVKKTGQRDPSRNRFQLIWGTAMVRSNKPNRTASAPLRRVIQSDKSPSVEEVASAWLGLAALARRAGTPAAELDALLSATQLPLDEVRSPELRSDLGRAFLRLAEDSFQKDRPRTAEERYTRAMSLLPDRAGQLQPIWEEAGRRAMAEIGRAFQDSRGRLLRPYPGQRAGPYEVWLYAAHYLRTGKPYRALATAEGMLEDYPGFPPALLVAGESYLGKNDARRGAEILVDLAERMGPDGAIQALLRRVPIEEFPDDTWLRWVRTAPREAGLIPFARALIAEGRRAEALAALSAVPIDEIRGEALVMRAELSAEMERWDDTAKLLEAVPARNPLFGRVAGLAVRATLKAVSRGQRPATLYRTIDKVGNARELDFPGLIRASESLLALADVEAASRLLGHLDSRYSFHRGEIVLRLAVTEVIRGRHAAAAQYLERAEPFFDGAELALGRLAISADVKNWGTYERSGADLARTDLAERPLGELYLLALAGRYEAAIARVDSLRYDEQEVPDPRPRLLRMICTAMLLGDTPWEEALIEATPQEEIVLDELRREDFIGRPGETRDPRQALALLVALEHPTWAAWSLARLRSLRGGLGRTPWPSYLIAQALYEMGEIDAAVQQLRRLTGREPPVSFAWLLRERIARETADESELAALRRDRVDVFGPLGLGTRELALVKTFGYELVGNEEEALATLRAAASSLPDDDDLSLRTARKELDLGFVREGLARYEALLTDPEGGPAEDVPGDLISEYISALRTAAGAGAIQEGVWWALLEALEARFPYDPSIARELARRTIESASDRPDWGVSRAWERLERFRLRTDRESIESLRAGEAERWLDLFIEHDPALGVAFATEELIARPTSPELWRLSARALWAAGRRREALRQLETLETILPDEETLRPLIRQRIELEEPDLLISETIDRFQRVADLEPRDPQVRYWRALSSLRGDSPKTVALGLGTLAELWEGGADAAPALDFDRLGRELAFGLLAGGTQRSDLQAASLVLGELEAKATDPFELGFLQATRALAANLTKASGAANHGRKGASSRRARQGTEGKGKGKGKGQGKGKRKGKGKNQEEAPEPADPGTEPETADAPSPE